MIPTNLSMTGFACYRDRTEIDFTDLPADLFAIAGPTGSGKSAILDAMTFALYGQTARLGSRGVLETLVSPGHEKMTVQLAFRTGQRLYSVTRAVSVRESGAAQEVRVERWIPGDKWQQVPETEKIRDANAALEEIVGLDYDGFTRAVLLPQGAFDQFLRGDSAKRRSLLTGLLGLDRIDAMREAAGSRAKDAKAKEQALATRLEEDFADATPEALAEQTEKIDALETAVSKWKAAAEKAREDLARKEEVIRVQNDRHDAARRLEEADKIVSSDFRDRIARAEAAADLLPIVQRAEKAAARHEEAKQKSEKQSRSLRTLETEASSAERRLDAAQKAAAERTMEYESFLDEAADLTRGFDLLTSREMEPTAGGGDGEPWKWEDWKDFEKRNAAWERIAETFERLGAKRDDLNERRRLLNSAKEKVTEAKAAMKAAEEERDLAKAALRTAEEQAAEADLHSHAHAVRNGIDDGDTCPVCGGDYVEADAPHLSEPIGTNLRAAQKRAYEAEMEVGRATFAYDAARDTVGRLTREAQTLADLVEELEAKVEAAGYEADTDADRIDDHVATERDALLARLSGHLADRLGSATPEERRKRLADRAAEGDRDLRTAEKQLAEAQSRVAAAKATRDELFAAEKEAERESESEQAAYLQAILASPFENTTEVREAFMPTKNLEHEQQRLADADEERATAEREVRIADKRLAEIDPDGEIAEERVGMLRHAAHETEREREQAREALTAATVQRDHLEEQAERAKELRAAKALTAKAADLYSRLALDLRSDRFPAYLLNRAQDALAVRASHVMRDVTGGRYDLALRDGEYHVLDAWNGGEPRSARTLSGGETFIASLALALALSEILVGHAELGALFLDEGFGTLDAQALDAVASVLENLTRDGRMVGVISHVDALTERMPARLWITPHATGSTAEWEA